MNIQSMPKDSLKVTTKSHRTIQNRMPDIVRVQNLSKTYASGHQALKNVSLNIKKEEILALLGPNGAGKTTLISAICGIVNQTAGKVSVNGFDTIDDYLQTRSLVGLVPQELTLGTFDTVWDTINFSRGLFNKPANPDFLEELLDKLSLLDKKYSEIRALSGGMKRRVLIAKALAHEPNILFLDEPTAGVDVELRKDMWRIVEKLRKSGVTIILTTHYIEEAQAIADRVGVINNGELLLVQKTQELMQKMGQKTLSIELRSPVTAIPETLAVYNMKLSLEGDVLTYTYDTGSNHTGITKLLQNMQSTGLELKDLQTEQSSLEEIFVNLVKKS